MSEHDDKRHLEQMAKLALENEGVDEDDDEEEEDTGMGEIDVENASVGITE